VRGPLVREDLRQPERQGRHDLKLGLGNDMTV